MEIGPYQVRTILAGTFRLDGGAMFGSVPRMLWGRKNPADESNRIELATRLLWLEGGGRKILVDAGNGDKFDERAAEMFAIKVEPPEEWGVAVEKVTDVILTHLHFDHAGGVSRRSKEGQLELVFPEAETYLQRENWDNARQPWARERASYLEENWKPLESAKLRLLDGPTEIAPSLYVEVAHGHTHGLQWVRVGEGRGALVYPSDLMPTASHIRLPWIMGYDRCAETSYEEKSAFLNRAVDEEWIVVFEHDARTEAVTIKRDARGRFGMKEKIDL